MTSEASRRADPAGTVSEWLKAAAEVVGEQIAAAIEDDGGSVHHH